MKQAVREHKQKHPGFVVETRDDFLRAMDGLNAQIDVMEDYAGYSIYDL